MGRHPLSRLGALALVLVPALSLAAGPSLSGRVSLFRRGEDGARVRVEDASGVLVYVTGFEAPAPEGPAPRMEQRDKAFVPEVLPVVKGQSVDFVNMDAVLHNVFSPSTAAAAPGGKMDLGKYKGPGRVVRYEFRRTGLVDLYCDIHESMRATVLVLPNPAFAHARADGTFSFPKDLPSPQAAQGLEAHLQRAGRVKVFAWAKGARAPASAEVEVTAGAASPAVVLELELKPGEGEPHPDKHGRPYASHPPGYGQ